AKKEDLARKKDLQDKKRRFIVGLSVGIPLFVLSQLVPVIPEFPNMLFYISLVMLIVSTPAFFYTSYPIFKAAFVSLKNKSLNMDVMYAMGIGVAYFSSIFGTIGWGIYGAENPIEFMFYEAAVLLAGFLMLGRFLEAKAKGRTSEAIKKLIGLQPKTATVIKDGTEVITPVSGLQIGDMIKIRPGEKVPTDGVVLDGKSYVDESMISGEPVPVLKKKGDKVVGGTINKNSVLLISAEKIGKDTLLSQIIKLVKEAQGSKAPIQKLADKVVKYFIPLVLSIAIVTFVIWLIILDDILDPVTRLITILVVACPCALGLATPTAVTVGIGRGAELGIIIRNGEVLEKVHDLTTIIFDKTGTLTKGMPELVDVKLAPNLKLGEADLLALVASVESNSQHPLAEAIVKYAKKQGLSIAAASDFNTVEGKGVRAIVNGKLVLIGNKGYLQENAVNPIPALENQAEKLEIEAKTVVFVAVDGEMTAVLGIADKIRPEASIAIAELDRMGISTMMLTGDNERTATAVARKIGIKKIKANVLPRDKSIAVKRLQNEGNIVGFAGDGINDAPALAQADVGIAMGGGTDIAIESGEIIVMRDSPADAVASIQLGRRVLNQIKLNLFWAFIYNLILIPVAIFGLFRPEFAGLAMAMSSVTVVSLSLSLKRFVPRITRKHDKPQAPPQALPVESTQPETSIEHDLTVLKCQACDKVIPMPVHCKKPMHVEFVNGKQMLVCWMGAECGAQDMPQHCGLPMIVTTNKQITGSKSTLALESSSSSLEKQGTENVHEKSIKMKNGVHDMPELKCEKCGFTQPVPQHCGKPMHVESINGKDELVCWMGAVCGHQDIPHHCSQPMTYIS
ncbi:MAG: copper-translocating P-type ATPase, partial [Promethearchaeota archaeon]